ncbi:MAG: porin [Thermoguttaceae bacterium]|nr:porin [Thermoguttaceae bacterium]
MCKQRLQVNSLLGRFVQFEVINLVILGVAFFVIDTAYGQMPSETSPQTTKVALQTKSNLPAIPFQSQVKSEHTLSLGNTPVTLAEPASEASAITGTNTQQAAPAESTAPDNEVPLVLPGPEAYSALGTPVPMVAAKPAATPQWSPLPTATVQQSAPIIPMTLGSNPTAPSVPLGPLTPVADSKVKAIDASTGDKTVNKDKADNVSSQLESIQKEIDDLKKGMKKKQDAPDPNKKFVNKVGGLLMLNPLFVDQDAENKAIYGNAQNQLEFQELRLILSGQGYGNLAYECTFGYNNGISFKDLRLTISDTPWLDEVRLGYFKVETGMNLQEWASNGPFIAQNSDTKTFRINRRIGAGSAHYYADERLRVFGGIFCGRDFDPGDDAKISSDLSGIILNTRITGLPIYCEDEKGISREVLHVGGNFSWVDPSNRTNNTTRLRVRPTSWTGSMPYMLNGTLDLDQQTYSLTGLETAWQHNQFAIQSEGFIGAYEDYSSAWSYNIMARYFLTPGACRIYDKHKGCFGKVNIPKNFMIIDEDGCRFFDGWGAWELTAMYTKMDLENLRLLSNPGANKQLRYGMYDEYIVGLNWFWNQQTAIMFNYIHSETDGAMIGSTDRSTSSNDTIGMQLRLSF